MTREETYEAQLRELGIWQECFRPAVKELAGMERELQRLKRRWRELGCPVEDKKDPLYPAICSLRRDILAQRDALGLTPKSLRRFRADVGGAQEAQQAGTAKPTVLALVTGRRREAGAG